MRGGRAVVAELGEETVSSPPRSDFYSGLVVSGRSVGGWGGVVKLGVG